MKKRKMIKKWLKTESAKLLPEYYRVMNRLYQPMPIKTDEGEKADYEKEIDGEKVGYRIVNAIEESYPVNHYRRLKRLFKKKGFQGVEQYFNDRNFTRHVESNTTTEVREEQELPVETGG